MPGYTDISECVCPCLGLLRAAPTEEQKLGCHNGNQLADLEAGTHLEQRGFLPLARTFLLCLVT